MKVSLAYVFPVHLPRYEPMAMRFARTYVEFPPGELDHDIHVFTNGGVASERQKLLLDPLCCSSFIQTDNVGKDIGAYQMAARTIECDLLVCLGTPVYFHRAGWLDWIVRAYETVGPGLFGCWGFYEPRHHLRTTAFWLPPQILASYPHLVVDRTRYEFEHGNNSIVNWTKSMGFENYMVTWKGIFPESRWHHVSRRDSLLIDQHCDKLPMPV